MATAAASMFSASGQKEEWETVQRRFEFIRTRPSTVAANQFFACSEDTDAGDWRTLPQRLQALCHALENWTAENGSPELPCSFSHDPRESRRIAMTAAIMASAPPSFSSSFQSLFRASLEHRDLLEQNEDSMEDVFVDEALLFHNLRTLGWIRQKGIMLRPLSEAIHKLVLNKIRDSIAGDFESEGLFQHVQKWKDDVVSPWLGDMMGADAFQQQGWEERLRFTVAECYCLVRMDEIFEMVADFPDSEPAVVELRQVLEITKMQNELGAVLRSSLIRRLNHPGANTSQIIDVYIATIKVLRLIDPSDRLLGVVAEPVRSYLRGRSDTVRCIITSLTDAEVGGDLYEELRRQDAKPLENVTVDSDDEEEPPDFSWQPPPSLNKPRGTFLEGGSRTGESDILAMLVSIYGSKELFVNEYRLMLADKLLANLDYNTDKQVHTLELLKLRFGEMSMRNCEVMIKDMDDSKRANANIHSTLEGRPSMHSSRPPGTPPLVDAAMISHIFWPTLTQNEQLKHHPRIQAELDEFSSEYARLKNPRKLIWLNQLGTVKLELEVVESNGPDGSPTVATKEIDCTPLQATIISHFEDRMRWTAEDLSNETGIAEHIIEKRMMPLIAKGIVRVISSPGNSVVYELASVAQFLEEGNDQNNTSAMDEDGAEGRAVSVSAHEEQEMENIESYIYGMLNVQGPLPLSRIHENLKSYASSETYNLSPQQLSTFLQHLCKREKLECGPDGMYKVYKS